MSFTLNDLVTPERGPLAVTIFGEPGLGKTSLGAEWPKPVILRFEDGSHAISHRKDVALTPVIRESDKDADGTVTKTAMEKIKDVFDFLKTGKHPFKTLVIDSLTELEVVLTNAILEKEKVASLAVAMGGYGKGYEYLSQLMGGIRNEAENLRILRGMHVVFIAHSQTRTEEPPDSESYGKYTLRLHKKSEGHFINNVDIVGFLRLNMRVKTDGERGRALSDGTRVLDCQATPYSCSKNRFGITDSIPYTIGTNPLAAYVASNPKEKEIAY